MFKLVWLDKSWSQYKSIATEKYLCCHLNKVPTYQTNSFSLDFTKLAGFRWYKFFIVRLGITVVCRAYRAKATTSNSMSIMTVHKSTTGRSSYSSSVDKSHKHVIRRGAVFCLTTILLRIHLPRVSRVGSPLIHRRRRALSYSSTEVEKVPRKGAPSSTTSTPALTALVTAPT